MPEVAARLDRAAASPVSTWRRREALAGDRRGEGYLGLGKIGRKDGPPR